MSSLLLACCFLFFFFSTQVYRVVLFFSLQAIRAALHPFGFHIQGYTPVPLGYVSPAHCSSTLKPSGNCLPVHQGLRVINSVLEPRSLHKVYRILTGSAQGSGLKGALNYWSVKKNNSHAPIGIRILFQNHPNTVKPNTK